MKLSRESRRLLLAAAGLTVWLVPWAVALCPPAFAEVGAVEPGAGQAVIPYINVSVTDEGDPVTFWRQDSTNPSRSVLNAGGLANGDGPPSLIVLPSVGEPVVAWSRSTATGFDVVLSRYADGAWTEPSTVSGLPADELDPVLLTDPQSGDVHLVYWVQDTVPRIEHRQAPADLSVWSAPAVLSQPGIAAARPSATWHAGALHVIYESHVFGLGQVPRQIVLTRPYDEPTTTVVTATDRVGPNCPRVRSDGVDLWVEWIDSGASMGWTRQVEPGTWDEIRLESFDGVLDRDYHAPSRIRAIVRQR